MPVSTADAFGRVAVGIADSSRADIINAFMSTSRRNVLKSIATAAAAAPLAAQHVHDAPGELLQIAAAQTPYKPKFFSDAELETVRLLVDLIIPRTDTPGASDAGVHRMIDTDVSQRTNLQKPWRDTLAWFDAEAQRTAGKAFAQATQEQQIALLTTASTSPTAPGWQFFTIAKSATVDSYYGTRQGLQTELGWNANTFLPEFKGCTHKEHQG